MSDEIALPKGPLTGVSRSWSYAGGWVRAPKAEIIFNDRLTMQARLLWLWLASIHPEARNIHWSHCEEALSCGTKSRRNCLSQLVEEGFITVSKSGVVVMHDPYKVFKKEKTESITRIERQFQFSDEEQIVVEEKLPAPKPTVDKPNYMEICQNAWNEYKPKSYQSVRKITMRQEEAVMCHLKNLDLPKKSIGDFTKAVCKGIHKDDFWLNKNTSKTFSTIFGYGKTLDKKLKNVELLYFLGIDQHEGADSSYISQENQELINTYKEYTFRLDKAKLSGDKQEIDRWTAYLISVDDDLKKAGISVEPV